MRIAGFMVMFLTVCGAMARPLSAQEAFRWFEVPTGIVEYDVSGFEEGEEIFYFDQGGMRQAKFRKTKVPKWGMQNMLMLVFEEWAYTMDLDKKVGKKVPNQMWQSLMAAAEKLENRNLYAAMLSQFNGQKKGEALVLDKKCEIWRVEKLATTFWFWQWIPLKIEVELAPKVFITATARFLETDVAIPEERFTLPEDIYFIDGNLNDILISRR